MLAKPENVLMMTSCGVLASCNVTGIAGGDDGGDECPQRAKLVVTAMSKNLLMMMLMTTFRPAATRRSLHVKVHVLM